MLEKKLILLLKITFVILEKYLPGAVQNKGKSQIDVASQHDVWNSLKQPAASNLGYFSVFFLIQRYPN